MIRLSVLFLLGGAGLLLSPAVSSAQFGVRFGQNYGYSARVPFVGPASPFFHLPQFNQSYSSQLSLNTMFGNVSFGQRYAYSGIYPQTFYWGGYNPTIPLYQQSGGYMTGGSTGRPDLMQQAEQALTRAQREAATPDAKAQISGSWKYETGTSVAPTETVVPSSDALRKALETASPAEITSGEALNELLKEIVRLEGKGAKGPSAYIPSLLMDDMRFTGTPAAELLNFARVADRLPFPSAFDDPTLATVRVDLAKDFVAAAVAVQAGKPPEAAKLARVEGTFQRAQDSAAPVIKNLPFEEATAARRFLNRMANAIKAMKGITANGLIDPKWSAEGLTVDDLVKHMTRHKLQFDAAPRGSEESYTAMHRNLATYLIVLTSPKK